MINILLTSALIKNGNKGCVALTVSALYLIDEIMKEKDVEYKIYLPDSGYDNLQKQIICDIEYYSCQALGLRSFIKSFRSIERLKSYISTIKTIKSASFLLDIGQGDSFADIYGERRFNLIHSKYLFAKRYKIPYCVLPQTIGPYKDLELCKKAFSAIDGAKSVLVRDRQSYDYVKEYLPNKQVTEVVDVAFFMPFIKKTFNHDYIHVGVNISALLWNGGYTRDNQFGLNVDYQSLVRSIITYFLNIPNVIIHLIPHVVHSESHVENDYEVSYNLQQEINDERVILAPLFFDPIAAKSYISGMDFFMGARMHATIAAFSTGVPVVPMAYSRKFNGLFVDTLEYSDMCDMKSESKEAILAKINDAYSRREELAEVIANRLSTVVADSKKKMMSELSVFFNLES